MDRRSDYTQVLFDQFVERVGVPEFAATVRSEEGSFFVATNDKVLFAEIQEFANCSKVVNHDTLFYGYSAFLSEPSLELGEAVRNAVRFESKDAATRSGKTFNTLLLAGDAELLNPAIKKVMRLHENRTCNAFLPMNSEANLTSVMVCDMALNNKKVLNKSLNIFGDKNLRPVERKLYSLIDDAVSEMGE